MSNTADAPTTSKRSQDEVDKILNREASAFQREVEVERILKAFKLKYATLYSFELLTQAFEIAPTISWT